MTSLWFIIITMWSAYGATNYNQLMKLAALGDQQYITQFFDAH